MNNIVIAGIIQGGALVLLAFVLWQVSATINQAMSNMQALLIKLIDLAAETKQIARESAQKVERNYRAMTTPDKPNK